ncbi:MAG: hypothetical protein H6934_06380 [Burkholderiaceae bacterium]|nr:hypothetical protein [Burkholderiaceae bacterium]
MEAKHASATCAPRPFLSLRSIDELPEPVRDALGQVCPIRLYQSATPALMAGAAFVRVERVRTLLDRLWLMRSDSGMGPAEFVELLLPQVDELHQLIRSLAWHPDFVADAERVLEELRLSAHPTQATGGA